MSLNNNKLDIQSSLQNGLTHFIALKTLKTTSISPKLSSRVEKLNSIYNSDSPIFRELLDTLMNEPHNNMTQLKIEKYLINQGNIKNKN